MHFIANDTVLTQNETSFNIVLEEMSWNCEVPMELNVLETKGMIVGTNERTANIGSGRGNAEQEAWFKYLGSIMKCEM